MNKIRSFITQVHVIGATLHLKTLSSTGHRASVTIPKTNDNPRSLLGRSVNFAFAAGETEHAQAMFLEPNVRAYIPEAFLDFREDAPENLDKIKNVHKVLVAKAKLFPMPFTNTGVQLPTGEVVGFQPGTDLSLVVDTPCLWTLGDEPETQAIVEVVPSHWWIEQIEEFINGVVNVICWNGERTKIESFLGVSDLREKLKVVQVTSDLIGEAITDSYKLLPGNRRGVPRPLFSVFSIQLDPNTLWQFAKVKDTTTVHFYGKDWTLKEPIAENLSTIIVTASDLVL